MTGSNIVSFDYSKLDWGEPFKRARDRVISVMGFGPECLLAGVEGYNNGTEDIVIWQRDDITDIDNIGRLLEIIKNDTGFVATRLETPHDSEDYITGLSITFTRPKTGQVKEAQP